MRVLYGELRTSERRKLDALDARIDGLFADALRCERDSGWWQRAISKVFRGLEAERWDDGSVIVRSEARELSPIAQRVVSRAPKGLSMVSKRPPRPLASALENLRRNAGLDLSRARFRAGFSRGHLLEVVLYLPGGTGSEQERASAERLIWDVLGESVANHWIGAVRVAQDTRDGPLRVVNEAGKEGPRLSLHSFAESVESGIRGVSAALPEAPAWSRAETDDWTLLELSPEGSSDWEAQDDLIITSTCEPEMLKCFLTGAPFSSRRFTRHDERYFYLKFASQGDLEERLAKRSSLEDALDRALVEARVGRVVGGGLGLAYTYVDFLVSPRPEDLEVARDVAARAKLSDRSWILPFDDDLAAEWLEIVPGSHHPPGISA